MASPAGVTLQAALQHSRGLPKRCVYVQCVCACVHVRACYVHVHMHRLCVRAACCLCTAYVCYVHRLCTSFYVLCVCVYVLQAVCVHTYICYVVLYAVCVLHAMCVCGPCWCCVCSVCCLLSVCSDFCECCVFYAAPLSFIPAPSRVRVAQKITLPESPEDMLATAPPPLTCLGPLLASNPPELPATCYLP